MNRTLLVTVSALVVAAGTAVGQESTRAPVKRGSEVYQPSRDARPVELVPSEALLAAKVVGLDGKKLAEINELVLSRPRGRVTFALIGHGGVLSIGEKVTAVPFGAMTWDAREKTMQMPMSAEKLKGAPTLEAGEWLTLADAARTEPIYSYFNVEQPMPTEANPPEERPGNPPKLKADQFPVLKVSEIKGKPLAGDDGREIGKVNELVIDANSGRVAFVVVTFGGLLGMGEERVPVPWPVFDVNKDGHLYAVNLDKEMVRNSPHFAGKGWDELREPGFGKRVYDHFGKSGSWLSSDEVFIDKGAAAAYDRMCAGGLPATVTGKVESVEEAPPVRDVPPVIIVLVNTGAGDPTKVHLGPRSYLDKESVAVRVGDTVSIKGREAKVDGRTSVIATEITPAGGKAVKLRNADGSCLWK